MYIINVCYEIGYHIGTVVGWGAALYCGDVVLVNGKHETIEHEIDELLISVIEETIENLK